MVLPKGPTRPGQPKKQELTVLDVAPVAGQTTGEAVYAVVLGDKETWLGTKADGTPTDYSMGKIETRLNARENLTAGGAVDSVNGETGAVVLDAADVGLGPVAPQSAWGEQRPYPRISKPLSAPIIDVSTVTATTVYWPTFVDRRAIGGSGVSILYSTDHGGAGGIYSATATSGPLGPYTDDGLIYQDTTMDWSQQETPSVIFNDADSLYYVYYHMKTGATWPEEIQRTILATTPDLTTFTRVGEVYQQWDAIETGNEHTGYFRPFRWAGTWWAWSLYGGGGKGPARMLWQSTDGVDWWPHPHRLLSQSALIDHFTDWEPGWSHKAFHGEFVVWRGDLWWIGPVGPPSTGVTASGVSMRLGCAPVRDDLRGFRMRPVDITPAIDQAWEGDGYTHIGGGIVWDGTLYVPYRGTASNSSCGVMEVS